MTMLTAFAPPARQTVIRAGLLATVPYWLIGGLVLRYAIVMAGQDVAVAGR